MKQKYVFVIFLFMACVLPAQLKANRYVDSVKTVIADLEHRHLIDTVLNTRLELLKYVKDSDYDLFLELASQNIVLAQKHKKNWALIDVYMEMGEVLVTRGIYNGALDHLNKALSLAENDNYKPYKGWINVAIGNAYDGMFNYQKSLDFYLAALDVFLETNNIDGIGLVASNLGTIYSQLNNYEKAEYYFEMGLENRQKLGNLVEIGFTRMYYASSKIRQGNYLQAESDIKSLLEYIENEKLLNRNNLQFLEANVLQAEVHTLLSDCENHKGDNKQEFLHLHKAVDIYKSIKDELHLASIYNRMGNRYLQTGNYLTAISFADSAYNVSEKVDVLTEQANSLKLKADAYSKLGRPQAALESFKAYKTINDSIYNSSVIQAISNVDVLTKTMEKEKELLILSMKFEQDKKFRFLVLVIAFAFILVILVYSLLLSQRYKKERQDGLILKEKNHQISEQSVHLEELNQKLTQLNKSKDRFHTIIAHDLKSPISAFYSLIDFLNDSYEALSDTDRKSFIDMAHQEVQRILKLLDNLLTWSRIQGGQLNINKSQFFIDEAIIEIAGSIKNMADIKNISFEMQELEHQQVYADKEMIMAVIRNLCTNAIKFTNPGQKFQMGVNNSNQMLEVWVRDFGIGIPKNKLNVLFEIDSVVQRKGTNDESGTGLGLQLCYEFIKMHDGKITVDSIEGKGSCFSFQIPLEC